MRHGVRTSGWILFLSSWLIAISCLAAPPLDENRLKQFLEVDDYWNVRLSPDGRHISLLTDRDGRNTLVVLDLKTMKPTASVKYEEDQRIEITGAEWIDPKLLYYTTSHKTARLEAPYLTPDLFVLAADGGRNDRLWNFRGNREDNSRGKGDLIRGWPRIISFLPDKKHEVLLFVSSFERRDGAGRGLLARMDLRSGDVERVKRTPEYTQEVLSSEDGSTLIAVTINREYKRKNFVLQKGGEWVPITFDLSGYTDQFLPKVIVGDFVYAYAQEAGSIDSDGYLLRYRISDKSWQEIYNFGFSTPGEVDVNDDGELMRLQWTNDSPRMKVFDDQDPVSRVLQSFAKSYPGFVISPVSLTEDKKQLLIHVASGAYRGEYFLYNAETRKARFLISMDEDINGAELAELSSAEFTASDGVKIPGWFQAPPGIEKPPLVVYIHGGPHGPYNQFGFNLRWHVLNAMGYAVYAPNFRGSGGFGQRFEAAGYGKWGTRMIDDMAEGARHLVEHGLVDGNRICAMGGSYGGYGTAQSLVRYPDLYRCGVIIAGFFDATHLKEKSDIKRWYAGSNYMAKVIGDDEDSIKQMSPIHNLDAIKAPMLILHGKKDERTPFKGARDFVEALEKADKTFEYHWYAKEGHGNVKLENRVDQWRRVEAFLARENGAKGAD